MKPHIYSTELDNHFKNHAWRIHCIVCRQLGENIKIPLTGDIITISFAHNRIKNSVELHATQYRFTKHALLNNAWNNLK